MIRLTRIGLLTLVLHLGGAISADAQTSRSDLHSTDPRVFDTVEPASYQLDFPLLPPSDPMSSLSTGDPFALGILSDPQALFDTINKTGLPTPPATPGDYNPEEIFLMGNFINEGSLLPSFSYPVGEPREIILLDYQHPIYYNIGKLSRTFMFEESINSLATPEILDVSPTFEWQRHHLRQIGPVRMALDLNQSVATTNNVFGAASDKKSDTFLTFNPRLYLETGTRGNASISYSPSFLFYQKYRQMNAQNENVNFSIRYPFTKLKVGGDFSYQTLSGIFLSSDGYTKQKSYIPRVFANYPVGGKTDITATYYSVISEIDPGGNLVGHNLTISADHLFSEKLNLGIYQERGYDTAPLGHQVYQTLGMRGLYRPSYHFRFSGRAGFHTRWLRPPADDLDYIGTPVFDITASYHRTSNTAVGTRIYREVATDSMGSVNLQVRNGIEGFFGIRLFSKTDIRFRTGFGHVRQWSSAEPRQSDFTFMDGSLVLSHRLSRNVEVALFDRFQRRLDSSFAENYSTNTIGLAINLQF